MASSLKRVDSKDLLTCFLCERLFTDPASAPCGHSFCRTCLTQHWDSNAPCRCPRCKKDFSPRPEPQANTALSDRISKLKQCQKHNLPLERFCRTDETLLCQRCMDSDHKGHHIVSLQEGVQHIKSSLKKDQAQTRLMLQQRQQKLEEFSRKQQLSQEDAEKEKEKGLQTFTALMQSLQEKKDQFKQEIQEKNQQNQEQVKVLVQELEQEISELEVRCTEVEQLSRSEDHLHVLQRSAALTPPAGLKDWSSVTFEPKTFEGTADKVLSEVKKLNENISYLMELKNLQQFAVNVTLDPDTAHPALVLSEDLKQVHCGDGQRDLPDLPQRFSRWQFVLGQQSFSSGRKFYFEVQVTETDWTLGVAQESVDRKNFFLWSPENGLWTIGRFFEEQYKAWTAPPLSLSLKSSPQKVGVFVDYDGGLVSFYDVDTADLLYSFRDCRFREKLFPILNSCDNTADAAPLTLTALKK